MAAAVLAGVMAGRAEAACSLKQIGEMKIEMIGGGLADPEPGAVLGDGGPISIPGNTTAWVFVPVKDITSVTESGKPIAQAEGVKFLRMESGAAVYEVGSGIYHFQTTFRPLTPASNEGSK